MKLSIIIVNYKSRDKLLACLKALRSIVLAESDYEIIVVDNNSGDDLAGIENYPGSIQFIQSSKNLGMGGGNNLGISAAQGEYILILNPDTILPSKAPSLLLDYLEKHPQVGLVGPKLIYPDGTLQLSCSRFPVFFIPLLRRTFLGDYFKEIRDRFTMNDFDHNSISPVDWLMGSCLMFKKDIKLRDGQIFSPRFDERYFMYFEDIDLCRQIWTKGLSVVYNPTISVIHDHERASAKYPWYLALIKNELAWVHIGSWLRYFIKWGFKKAIYGGR